MFLHDYPIPISLKPQSTNYKTFYQYRMNELLEYMMQLFTYHDLPDSIPEHEIDLYLYLYGHCGIVRNSANGDLLAVVPQLEGTTDYYDIFRNFIWTTPKSRGGRVYIDHNGVLIDNTKLHNNSIMLIHTTAARLAHIDVSLICELVNKRDSRIFKVISQKFAEDANNYLHQLYNGTPASIVDKGFNTVEIADLKSATSSFNVRELVDTSQLILSEFLEQIGIKKTMEKRERLISAETTADTELLKLNISNMFSCRKKGIAEVNEMFGTNISVECNVDISNYSLLSEDQEVNDNETD